MKVLVTGGCGFIGSNFIRYMLGEHPDISIINLDKLTYAGNVESLRDVASRPNYAFVHGDIRDRHVVDTLMKKADAVVHFAAESHVDRSIENGMDFVRTNVLGTGVLLESAMKHHVKKFVHISTDEVYGSTAGGSFKETDRLNPSSPYSSTKAGSDLLAIAYNRTHGLPAVITRCTNNYGPYQYPEKLIPLFATNLLEGKKVPLYGTGQNVRDWIHVLDHCKAIDFVLQHGEAGEIYNVGGGTEKTNMDIARRIIDIVGADDSMIEHVKDRPGHDQRYSLDCSKLNAMGWRPEHDFDSALEQTVRWYADNRWWWEPLKRLQAPIDILKGS